MFIRVHSYEWASVPNLLTAYVFFYLVEVGSHGVFLFILLFYHEKRAYLNTHSSDLVSCFAPDPAALRFDLQASAKRRLIVESVAVGNIAAFPSTRTGDRMENLSAS